VLLEIAAKWCGAAPSVTELFGRPRSTREQRATMLTSTRKLRGRERTRRDRCTRATADSCVAGGGAHRIGTGLVIVAMATAAGSIVAIDAVATGPGGVFAAVVSEPSPGLSVVQDDRCNMSSM
jgi:hypothetical protein